MATKRTAVSEDVAPVNHGFDASDLTLPRLRVVGKQSDLAEAGIAKGGDLAIGNGSDDEDSTIYPAPGGAVFHVLTWRSNYACGFNGPKGSWEEGDPEMPADAKKQYHYTLCVPGFDTILPVQYTANGTAAREFRKVNTALAQAGLSGKEMYEVAFELTTKTLSATIGGQQKTWPGPVVKRAKATEENIEIARAMHVSIVGEGRKQIASGDDSTDTAPSF